MAGVMAAQLWRRQSDDDGFDSSTGAPIGSADAYDDDDYTYYDSRDSWWWSGVGRSSTA